MSDTPRFNSYWNSYRSGAISVEEFKEAVQNLERENAALKEALERADMALEMLGIGSNVPVRFIARDAINYAARKEAQP